MRFQDLFGKYTQNTDILVSESGRLKVDTLKTEKVVDGSTLPRGVALSFSNIGDLVQGLAHCDGRVEEILLLSPSIDQVMCRNLMERAGVVALYSDRDDLTDAQPITKLTSSIPRDNEKETKWLMATSGTTNVPKLVAHTLNSLTRTVRFTASDFVWGQVYDSYRFAGMQVLLQAIAGGSLLVVPNPQSALEIRLRFFIDRGVTALSATPTLWRKIIMTGVSQEMSLRSITLGGEIADQPLLTALASRFPEARIRHIYASTESGTGFSVNDGKAGFPIDFVNNGYNGIGIKIVDDILYIENPFVSGKYYGGDFYFADESFYVNTGDRVKVEGDRVFFMGRASGVINVGGDKVYPETVENVLNSVPGVGLSRVYGKKSPITGELVVADIVLANDANKIHVDEQMMTACKQNLETFQRPIAFNYVDYIAVSQSGKVLRS